jgi:uncharacterized protein GlcG (DUF336 family)
MTLRNKTILAATVFCFMQQAAFGQVISHKDMSYQMARSIAEGALEKCLSEGYAVSAVVVDRDGETIIALRGDNAAPHTMENARRKAYTAMAFKTATTAYAKKFADKEPTVLQQVTLPNIIAIGGGLPIKIGKEILGGAGISGSPGVDEGCTQAGIDKVADQLE